MISLHGRERLILQKERLTLEKLIAIWLCSRVGSWLQDSATQIKMTEEQCLFKTFFCFLLSCMVNTFEQYSGMFNQEPTRLFMFKMHRWHSEINDYGFSDKNPVISWLCNRFSTGRELLTFNWPDSARSVEKGMEPPFCRINTAKSGGHNNARYLSVVWVRQNEEIETGMTASQHVQNPTASRTCMRNTFTVFFNSCSFFFGVESYLWHYKFLSSQKCLTWTEFQLYLNN